MRRRRPQLRSAAIMTSPAPVSQVRTADQVDKAIGELAEGLDRLANPGQGYVDVDLIVGTNRVNHGLGRTPVGVSVQPFEASSSFGWGFDPAQADNPMPHRQAWIEVVGAPMSARVFLW